MPQNTYEPFEEMVTYRSFKNFKFKRRGWTLTSSSCDSRLKVPPLNQLNSTALGQGDTLSSTFHNDSLLSSLLVCHQILDCTSLLVLWWGINWQVTFANQYDTELIPFYSISPLLSCRTSIDNILTYSSRLIENIHAMRSCCLVCGSLISLRHPRKFPVASVGWAGNYSWWPFLAQLFFFFF